MLKQILVSTNKNLDNLINITLQDIEDIKIANHEPLFERNKEKEKLITEFMNQKNQIDTILLKRSESGLSLENMLNNEENELFEEFKTKLQTFYDIHKKFAKLALAVANFYNNLTNKVNQTEVDIGYKMTQKHYSNFSLKV